MVKSMPQRPDPVERLVAEFDGTELAALVLRRAILKATAPLPVDHPAHDALDVLADNIDVAVVSNQMGGWQDLRGEMLRQWRAIREAVNSSLN